MHQTMDVYKWSTQGERIAPRSLFAEVGLGEQRLGCDDPVRAQENLVTIVDHFMVDSQTLYFSLFEALRLRMAEISEWQIPPPTKIRTHFTLLETVF